METQNRHASQEFLTVKSLVIRCGTPDCDWGHRVQDLGEEQLDLRYAIRNGTRPRTCIWTWTTGC